MLDKIVDKLFEKLAPILVERLSALIPVVVAAVAKEVGDQLKSQLLITPAPGAGLTDGGLTEPAFSESGFYGAADSDKSRLEVPQ